MEDSDEDSEEDDEEEDEEDADSDFGILRLMGIIIRMRNFFLLGFAKVWFGSDSIELSSSGIKDSEKDDEVCFYAVRKSVPWW